MIDRRTMIGASLAAMSIPLATAGAHAEAVSSRITAYAFSFPGLSEGEIHLAEYSGRPLLVVNTASQCGYTGQFAGLQELWTRYRQRGLMVIGVPSNDFGNQEPGSPSDIMRVAGDRYGVTFPLASKVSVSGENAHPFYKWASFERPGSPRWNFHKFLIGRDGRIVGSFPSAVDPLDESLIAAVEKELPASNSAAKS